MPSQLLAVNAQAGFLEKLEALLPPTAFEIEAVESCALARRALSAGEYDVLLINAPLPDDPGAELALYAIRNSAMGVLLLLPSAIYRETADQVEPLGVLTLEKPCSKAGLYSAVRLCVATKARLLRVEQTNRRLSDKMDELKLVNRAKWVLIKCLAMGEGDAHRFIEKQAMDMRCTKREIAEKIINTYEG